MKIKQSTVAVTIGVVLLVLLIIGWLFAHPVLTSEYALNKRINSNLFADYGTFISGLISAVTLVLVYFAFLATRNQIELSQKQNFDTTFFHYVESHKAILERLQQGRYAYVMEEYEKVVGYYQKNITENAYQVTEHHTMQQVQKMKHEAEIYLNNIKEEKRDVIDILYNMLGKAYWNSMYLNWNAPRPVPERVRPLLFLMDYMFENYFRNFISILKFIDDSNLKEKEKLFYAHVLRDLSSLNDLRLLFYFIIKKVNLDVARDWKKLVAKYETFAFLDNNESNMTLIKPGEDREYYDAI